MLGGNGVTSSVSGGLSDGSLDIEDTVERVTQDLAPNITTDDIIGRLEDKGNGLVKILQTVGKMVYICSFIVCCGLLVIGVIGNRRMVAGSIIGAILSGVSYAGIVCGKEIVNWIAMWAAS